ncbi:MAG: hypothetical protein CMJ65_04225 [Planctomycetaceae bacterium]|jgi:dihydroorotate dehydrogenase|nr:hypothetical protein [Planctomycetaceae bacterium]
MTTDSLPSRLRGYDRHESYEWNYANAPDVAGIALAEIPGDWTFCGRPCASPLGMPAGPLLNGRWILYYASLGFDVLTYKTVRSVERSCYDLPNLQPVVSGSLRGDETEVPACDEMSGSWAVSFGMPSQSPEQWRRDIEWTRRELPAEKLLNVSVVASIEDGWTIDDTADDYARCARWAVESGADSVETNFSCPNVNTADGQLYQVSADAGIVAERVREAVGTTPFVIKAGHVTEAAQAEELLAAVAGHVDAIAMTNSVAASVRRPDGTREFDGQRRGICGAATREASLEQTRLFAGLVESGKHDVSLIGVGGAASAADVEDYLTAGAESVHIATAAMVDPLLAQTIRSEWVDRQGR